MECLQNLLTARPTSVRARNQTCSQAPEPKVLSSTHPCSRNGHTVVITTETPANGADVFKIPFLKQFWNNFSLQESCRQYRNFPLCPLVLISYTTITYLSLLSNPHWCNTINCVVIDNIMIASGLLQSVTVSQVMFYMTLTPLKIHGQVFCRKSLGMGLSDIFS